MPASPSTIAPAPRIRQPAAWKRWLAGAPAMIAVLVGLDIYLHARSQSAGQSLEWYRQQADESFDAGDFKTAMVCYARVSQGRPADLAVAFSLFQCMESVGQGDAAKTLLARLAPVASPGYAPAQVLVAKRLLSSKNSSAAMARVAVAHLHQAVAAGSDDPSLSVLTAEATARAGTH